MELRSTVGWVEQSRIANLQEVLLGWFAEHGSNLPWRQKVTPYAVLVSEVMLQQTQRERVVPKFVAFMEQFPTLEALAAASASAVIRTWAGLGYNNRALRLQQTARMAAAGTGELPADVSALVQLPGIGRYTAGAIACFGFGQQVAFVDTNVRRVLRRVLCGDILSVTSPKLDAELAVAAMPSGRAADWHSAVMDLGALICTARNPRCGDCPLKALCLASPRIVARNQIAVRARRAAETKAGYRASANGGRLAQPFNVSNRYYRGRIVDALRRLPDGTETDLAALSLAATGMALPSPDERIGNLVERLVREGMVVASSSTNGVRTYRLPD